MRIASLVMIGWLLAGCATTGSEKGGGLFPRAARARELSSAVELLRKGDAPRARKVLAGICDLPSVSGVTDEALFRLALLSLKPTEERDAHQLLRRLKKEFPASPWTAQAAPLVEFLGGSDELKRQVRRLKGSNLALTRENEELSRQAEELGKRIEQMKHLDLELEKKSR